MNHSPPADKSFRRLHIMSMLAFTYLATGRYHLARKFGHQTLELAAQDESDRFKSRCVGLDAELKWEIGEIDQSQELLKAAAMVFAAQGVQILEQMSTYNRYLIQCASLGEDRIFSPLKMEDSLKRNIPLQLEYTYGMAQIQLNRREFEAAKSVFVRIASRGRQSGIRLAEARGLLGIVQAKIGLNAPVTELEQAVKELENSVSKLGDIPIKAEMRMAFAALAYRKGNFDLVARILKECAKTTRISFGHRFVCEGWISTIEGRSYRLGNPWQLQMLARFTRIYFRPTIEIAGPKLFTISGKYEVNLDRYSALSDLLQYLILKNSFSATPAEVQREVWGQSLEVQGWAQKIRNTVMRLRDLLPFTLAPLILQNGGELRLFWEAIEILVNRRHGVSVDDEVLMLLRNGAMSSMDLAERLRLSPATIKRILKRITDEGRAQLNRSGRNITYTVNEGELKSDLH